MSTLTMTVPSQFPRLDEVIVRQRRLAVRHVITTMLYTSVFATWLGAVL